MRSMTDWYKDKNPLKEGGTPFVTQSVAKSLENIHVNAPEILRRDAPLDDKKPYEKTKSLTL